MIRGSVNTRLEVVVPIRVRGSGGAELDVTAVVDTGFSAFLTVPVSLAELLELKTSSVVKSRLADGSILESDLYVAEVFWDDLWIPVLATAIGDEVLIGMNMLEGHRVLIEAVRGGAVEIDPIR